MTPNSSERPLPPIMSRARRAMSSALPPQHAAPEARDGQRLTAGVALKHRGALGGGGAFVLHAPEAQAALQPERDLGLHVGELLLDQLVGGERPAELFSF